MLVYVVEISILQIGCRPRHDGQGSQGSKPPEMNPSERCKPTGHARPVYFLTKAISVVQI